MGGEEIRVGGAWLSSLGWWGGLTVTWQWPRGAWEASWSMALDPLERPPALVEGAPVEVYVGGGVEWPGSLTDINWDEGTFTAAGAARYGDTALCLAPSGETTSTPDTAIDAAITRGAVTWRRPASLSSVPYAEAGATESPADDNQITSLLDAWSEDGGKRWAVDETRRIYAATDPTTPTWYVAYGAGVLGVADDRMVGTLVASWWDSSGTKRRTTAGSGRPEVKMDLTSRGVLTASAVNAILANTLARTGARTAFTSSITVTPEQIWTPGMINPHPSRVRAGHMVRMLGITDPRTGAIATDVILGQTVWDRDAETIQLTPVDLAARDLASIMAEEGGLS